ncbi:hypothetical protein MKX03_013438 [Papaver bracteatum]|nr:hypothetical protein MKX03_013438 [Papaver bracteatum]
MESARKLLDEVPHRDSYEKASQMFAEMRIAGEQPDEVTMLSLLSACTDSGRNALVDMYAKCGGYIGKAIEVFRGMRWNSIIGRLAIHGFAKESIDLFPDEITFIGVLVSCSHGGMSEKGHMFGRARLLEEAFEFAESMGIVPNPIVWRSLLGACRIHGNLELGKRANERLLSLRHDQSGDYVLLSNIYASEGQWEGAQNVRKLMEDRGVKKETGCTLTEADNKDLMHFLSN